MSLRKFVLVTGCRLGLASMLGLGGCVGDHDSVPGSKTSDRAGVGRVDLGLILPDGSDVGDPTYTITRPSDSSFAAVNGTLTLGSGGTASASITGLPAGSGYHVAITAVRSSPADAPACAGAADFEVLANAATVVNVILHCDDTSADTNVTINGSFNVCPKISSTSHTPSSAVVGGTIAFSAVASDKDGDTISYRWTADGVEFGTTAATTYSCTTPGDHSVNLTVSDGPSRGCSKSLPSALVVTCTGGDAGTTPDAGTPDTGTEPDTSVPDTGTAPDTSVPDTGTEPDTSVPDTGTPDTGTPDTGTPDTGTPDTGTPGPSWPLGSAACVQCQQTNCTAYGIDSANVLDPCSDSLCRQLVACTLDTDCFTSTANIPQCFCGGTVSGGVYTYVSTDTCLGTGYPTLNGPCLALTQQGLETTDKGQIFERTVNPAYPAGRGYQLVTCIADLCQTDCL